MVPGQHGDLKSAPHRTCRAGERASTPAMSVRSITPVAAMGEAARTGHGGASAVCPSSWGE
jgi:hypothetical protein